jgi:uridine kinase
MRLEDAVEQIIAQWTTRLDERALLVAISGIDGSGKGYITAKIADQLTQQNIRVATIHLDGWLNLPSQRFSPEDPAAQFYAHGFRLDDLFTQLVIPLRDRRSIYLEADYLEETDTAYRRQVYRFEAIDIILLEGIFLLKRSLQSLYDLSFWIDCRFETALNRAIARSQEGLSPAETRTAYNTIFFPAQRLHFDRDEPRLAATAIISNDSG